MGEHLDYFLFLLVSRTGTVGWTDSVELKCQSVRSLYGVWSLAASMEKIISMPMLSRKAFATILLR